MTPGIIIQARMGSTRLPGKILKKAGGIPLLQVLIDRLKQGNIRFVIATTTKEADNVLADFCSTNTIPFFRGDEDDVLSRYYLCAQKFEIEPVIRITSDCPLLDAAIIEGGLEKYLNSDRERLYLSNTTKRTFPRGFDFEIFSYELLSEANSKATDSTDREHVTPFLWKNKPGNIVVEPFTGKSDDSDLRLTVDTEEDYILIKSLIESYGAQKMSGPEIIKILRQHPELAKINAHVEQKKT
jgi:spore coat polysaccharide biosynthesis protein SpsF